MVLDHARLQIRRRSLVRLTDRSQNGILLQSFLCRLLVCSHVFTVHQRKAYALERVTVRVCADVGTTGRHPIRRIDIPTLRCAPCHRSVYVGWRQRCERQTSVITRKAAIHDQFKTGHTLEAVQDIGCSILPPAAEASLFLCANCVDRISARGHDAAGDRAWR